MLCNSVLSHIIYPQIIYICYSHTKKLGIKRRHKISQRTVPKRQSFHISFEFGILLNVKRRMHVCDNLQGAVLVDEFRLFLKLLNTTRIELHLTCK